MLFNLGRCSPSTALTYSSSIRSAYLGLMGFKSTNIMLQIPCYNQWTEPLDPLTSSSLTCLQDAWLSMRDYQLANWKARLNWTHLSIQSWIQWHHRMRRIWQYCGVSELALASCFVEGLSKMSLQRLTMEPDCSCLSERNRTKRSSEGASLWDMIDV